MSDASTATTTAVDTIAEQGWVVLPEIAAPDLVDDLAASVERLHDDGDVGYCDNDFEGHRTKRIYNLLARDGRWAELVAHPTVTDVVRGVLGRGFLLSSLSSIEIHPGETAQPIHSDDILMPLPRPHVATVCNSMWALTDFTAANGATRLVSGSHLSDRLPGPDDTLDALDVVTAEMPKGSVLIWHGSLWHAGGPHTGDPDVGGPDGQARLGIASNYCAGWIRQQENQQLGIPPELVRTFPPEVRQLIGYDLYRNLIGHVDKQRPDTLLMGEGDESTGMVWDR